MKTIRFVLVLMLLAVLLVVAGCDKHYVDVYINDECAMVAIDNDTAIDPLMVFPGDYVIFNNISGDSVIIDLPDDWFEEDLVSILKDKRVILKVIRTDPGRSDMGISCTIGGAGAPKVVVGEEP
jgi:hypothetical protein